jgi:hypothetical protein
MQTTIARRLLPAALLAITSVTSAQPAPGGKADPLNAIASVPRLAFRSTLSGYKPYADQPVGSWRQVNETVNSIGGWRVYAREASQPDTPATSAPADSSTPPAPTTPAPASAPAVHGGHKTN